MKIPTPIAGRPHWVYRLFDADDRLLYIGCTNDPANRMRVWRATPWFAEVVRAEWEDHPTRAAALVAEAAAIRAERPVHNRDHNRTPVYYRSGRAEPLPEPEPRPTGLLTAAEVADRYGFSEKAIRNMAYRKQIPFVRVGTGSRPALRFDPDRLDRVWVEHVEVAS